ncbi:MAG: ABC transporter substrate-binding protein [Fimbriimonadaceae bacterium]|nr:ABC transporter substrate-binding protein [Alphaproteobacteria bacterium]
MSKESNSFLTRRGLVTSLLAGLGSLAMGGGRVLAATGNRTPERSYAEGAGVEYMNRISKDLFNAAKQGTDQSFLRAINSHAAIPQIAEYSLGSYSDKMTPELGSRYQRGVANFMARYFSAQAQNYKVERAQILSENRETDGDIMVKTRIFLENGAKYNVEWLLTPTGRTFKVRDLNIAGFWLLYFQRRMFEKFITKNNGDVRALIAALRV